MQMTLEEQEQTQVEQDQVLEAKLEETERLARGKTRLLTYFKAYFFIFFLLLLCFPFYCGLIFIIIYNKKVFIVFLEYPVTCYVLL